eukprot:4902997-Pleurochrysis_carterae.AAC.1
MHPLLSTRVHAHAHAHAHRHAHVPLGFCAGLVPRALDTGVRADRCAFGWGLHASLSNFGASWNNQVPCDARGAVLPFPYATGAGYIFSAALLSFVANSAEVRGWVADAAGSDHEQANRPFSSMVDI